MNAPFPLPAPIGTRDELRQVIAENLSFAVVHIEHAIDLANIGTSDAGLAFALRSASAHFGTALASLRDLMKGEDAND